MNSLLKKYRQDLHMIPEIGDELHKTKSYILEILHNYDCEIIEVIGTGVCAYFKSNLSNNDAKTIAFRSDMDGLPVKEDNHSSYSSIIEGNMHACGHDGHMSMLLGLAYSLNEMKGNFKNNALLIFQPAEETTGGAQFICETGILKKYSVDMIFGFHLWPMLEKHAIGSRAKEFMAQSSEIDITINGKSVHCANASEGIDALYIGCEYINKLYEMEREEISENEHRLLKFGKMSSGTVRNAISSKTVLQGTLRCFNEETGNFISKRISEISIEFEEKTGCNFIINKNQGYPPVINDEALFNKAKDMLSDFNFIIFKSPFMQAEDFSFYQQEVPGLFLFLGTGTNIPLHSSTFDFDEDVLTTGVNAYLKLLNI